MGSIPESGRSSEGGHGNLLQHSCLENPLDRGACGLQSMGSQELDTAEHVHTDTHIHIQKHSPWRLI